MVETALLVHHVIVLSPRNFLIKSCGVGAVDYQDEYYQLVQIDPALQIPHLLVTLEESCRECGLKTAVVYGAKDRI